MMDVSTFRSQMKIEPAKSSRFLVNIIHPVGWNDKRDIQPGLKFMAHEALLSGLELETSTLRYYGPYTTIPFQSKVSDLEIIFYTDDEEMKEFNYLLGWILFIHGNGTYDFNFPNEYQTTIEIEKLAETGTTAFKMQYLKAYPVAVEKIPLEWGEDDFIKIRVQFAYTDFKIIEIEHHGAEHGHTSTEQEGHE